MSKIMINSASEDFAPGVSQMYRRPDGWFIDLTSNYSGQKTKEAIRFDQIMHIELSNETTGFNTAGAVGWGIAGDVVLGNAGLLAGILLGGRKKEVTFEATLIDGRKFFAKTDDKTYKKMHDAVHH